MSLIKWSPFLLEPFEESDRLFEGGSSALSSAGKGPGAGLIPLADVYEEGAELVVEMPLPGMDAKDIELSVDRGILSVKAVSERKTEVDEKNYYRKEVRHGLLFRRIPLPSPIEEDGASAKYEDGVLKVRFPKRDPGQAKTIKIAASDRA